MKNSLAVPTLLVLALSGCKTSEEKPATESTATRASSASAMAVSSRAVATGEARAGASLGADAIPRPSVGATIGGQIVTVGEHAIELRLFKDASAEALVYDDRGLLLADQSGAVAVVHALTAGGTRPIIALAFAAPLGRLSGAASAKADLVPGPIAIDLKLGGASATGRLEAPVLLVGPQMGGTLAVAGSYGVELLAHADGAVEAVIHDAAGALVNGDAHLKIELDLTGIDGQAHAVILAFDAARARFVGKAEAGVKLAAGAAQISINGGANAHLPRLALVAAAQHGGRVLVAGDFSVELVSEGQLVSAFVYDASGAASARANLDLALRLGHGGFVKLAWDAPSASYRAKLTAKLSFDVEPITLALRADAKTFIGARLPDLKAVANIGANAKASATVDVKALARAKLAAKSDIKAPAASATASIQAPKISVGVGTGTKAGAGAKAGASFSFGTK